MDNIDINTVMLLIIALLNFGGLVLGILTRNKVNILEVNTNSIKDALVKRTAEAAFAAGGKEERDKAVAEAKVLLANKT